MGSIPEWTELACACCRAGSPHPPAHAPLLPSKQQVCGTNEGSQVLPRLLILSHEFAFLFLLTGKRKLLAFKLILIDPSMSLCCSSFPLCSYLLPFMFEGKETEFCFSIWDALNKLSYPFGGFCENKSWSAKFSRMNLWETFIKTRKRQVRKSWIRLCNEWTQLTHACGLLASLVTVVESYLFVCNILFHQNTLVIKRHEGRHIRKCAIHQNEKYHISYMINVG